MLEGDRSGALPYGLLMFFEIGRRSLIQISLLDNTLLVLMSTTAFLRYRYYLGSHSALMRSIYRDGLLYMFCIMSMDTIVIIDFVLTYLQ